jgi:hypothetical protein
VVGITVTAGRALHHFPYVHIDTGKNARLTGPRHDREMLAASYTRYYINYTLL